MPDPAGFADITILGLFALFLWMTYSISGRLLSILDRALKRFNDQFGLALEIARDIKNILEDSVDKTRKG